MLLRVGLGGHRFGLARGGGALLGVRALAAEGRDADERDHHASPTSRASGVAAEEDSEGPAEEPAGQR